MLGEGWSLRMSSLSALTCRFNSTIVPALMISGFEAQCISPSSPAGVVVVEASNDGKRYTYSGRLRFTYVDLQLISLYPSHGPPKGGTVVSIYGQGFGPPVLDEPASQKLFCVFQDGVEVPATHRSGQLLTCTSPVARPAATPTTAHTVVRLKQNGALVTGGLAFTYLLANSSLMGSHHPLMGPMAGGTLISFTMTYADPSTLYGARCVFGQVGSPATDVVPSVVESNH
jgi:hypothetical protein